MIELFPFLFVFKNCCLKARVSVLLDAESWVLPNDVNILNVTEVCMLRFTMAGAVVGGTASACHEQGLFSVSMRIDTAPPMIKMT